MTDTFDRKLRIFFLISIVSAKSLKLRALDWKTYSQPGELLIGGVFPIHKYDEDGKLCSKTLLGTLQTQFIEAMVFGVQQVNKRNDILPNISLGFVILDDCTSDRVALARATSFLPRMPDLNNERKVPLIMKNSTSLNSTCTDDDAKYGINSEPDDFQPVERNSTTNSTDTVSSTAKYHPVPHYDVVTVLGAMRSQNSLIMAELLGLFQMPQMSAVSTSDALSNDKYDYFLRMASPDMYQAVTIVSLMQHFGWTYISVLYSRGSYGVGGMERISKLTKKLGICIAYSKELLSDMDDQDNDDIIKALQRHAMAKAVVLFANAPEAKKLLEAAHRAKTHGEFIWIISDGLSSLSSVSQIVDIVEGAFMVTMYSVKHPTFDNYFKTLNPYNNPNNPWFKEFWQLYFECSFFNFTKHLPRCTGKETITENNGYKQDKRVTLFVDAVEAIARGIHNVIQYTCPDAFNKTEKLRECITGEKLRDALMALNFTGILGQITFDSNGDLVGKYIINHVKHGNVSGYYLEPVAVWSKEKGITVNDHLIRWNVKQTGSENIHMKPGLEIKKPKSLCSDPCARGQIFLKQEIQCCWICHSCHENQVTDLNLTSCVTCSEGTWPNDKRLLCVRIKPEYLTFPQTFAIALVILASIGILSCVGTFWVWIVHRKDKLIKASSKQLSYLILTGLFMSFITSISYLSKPTTASCIISRVGFHLSFSLIYAPLLIKTCRIYRIFDLSRRSAQVPTFIGNTMQVITSISLIVFQMVLVIVTSTIWPPAPTTKMPVKQKPYLELFCTLPKESLLIPLAINLILVLLCLFFGFKTRKLPENFNESKCIFLCVCSTIFLFVAFLPTYFAAFYAYHKSVLLSLCLVLNATVMLLCLFVPKIYALYYVDENDLLFYETSKVGSIAESSGSFGGIPRGVFVTRPVRLSTSSMQHPYSRQMSRENETQSTSATT